MRTTLTLDPDVAEKASAAASELKKPFKQVINEALRIGLEQLGKPPRRKPYHMKPHRMGLRPGYSLDNIGELLAQIEGEDWR